MKTTTRYQIAWATNEPVTPDGLDVSSIKYEFAYCESLESAKKLAETINPPIGEVIISRQQPEIKYDLLGAVMTWRDDDSFDDIFV